MSKKAFLFFAVILPLCLATAIYLLFRDMDLVVFSLLEKINLLPVVLETREFTSSFLHPYFWIVFSLPGSLWMLSSMNLLLLIWNFKIEKQNAIWIFTPFVFAVGLEIIQGIHWTDGTFDLMDLVLYGCALILFFLGHVLLTKEGPIAHYGRSFLRQEDKHNSEKKHIAKSKMHLQSLAYTLCLISIVYCSDKITNDVSHTNPSDTSTEVLHTASIHNLSPSFPAASNH